jgi:quercetin dioxygenase-like cupin family protein/DNA-binding XRE family transcriptional regulator
MPSRTRQGQQKRKRGRTLSRQNPAKFVDAAAVDYPKIGTKLRHARLTKGLSLKQLGIAAGCSESFVSKIEHNHVRPSLAMLHRLVRVLEINVAALFNDSQDEDDPVVILSPTKRPVIRTDPLRHGKGITLERLVPNARSVLLQANIHHVEPGGTSDGQIQHEGEEVGYVLEGELDLTVESRTFRLKAGDSFFFPSQMAHGYRNATKRVARVVWVNSPPSF